MRFQRLDLLRFGAFSDCPLDLSAPGIHVIVGRNEAGKTTAMAAIRQLLFGIPVRSRHAFRHAMKDLAIGAAIQDPDGDPLEIVRVKKRSNTLQDPDGNTLDEALLSRLLYDVSEEVYTSLFTIGHEEIDAGGKALLSSEGEVGRALFSASRGTTDLTAVMRRLDERADALFKASGSKPELNAAIHAYKVELAEAKELSRSAKEVQALDKELAAARDGHEAKIAERKQLAGQKVLLEQFRATRPMLDRRAEDQFALRRLEADGPVDVHVGQEYEDAVQERQTSDSSREWAAQEIQRLETLTKEMSVDEALLEERERIGELVQASGAFDLNVGDLPNLQAKVRAASAELEKLRSALPDGCRVGVEGGADLSVDEEARIKRLVQTRVELDRDFEHAAEAVSLAEVERAGAQTALDETPDVVDISALRAVSARVRKEGDLDALRATAAGDLETVQMTLGNELAELGFGALDVRAVDSIQVPTMELIRSTRAALDKSEKEHTALEVAIESLVAERVAKAAELDALLRRAEPPTAEALSETRQHRDEGWQRIRTGWIDVNGKSPAAAVAAAKEWAEHQPVPDAYEAAVHQADDVADRLRREASAVERRANLERRIEELGQEIEAKTVALAANGKAIDEAGLEWTAHWALLGITPGTPATMEVWRDRFRDCAKQSAEARRLYRALVDLEARIAQHRQDIVSSLAPRSEAPVEHLSLLGLLDHVDQLCAREDAAHSNREKARARLASATQACTATKATRAGVGDRLTEWTADWSASSVAVLGLQEGSLAAEASAVLDTLQQVATKAASYDNDAARVAGIEARIAEFNESVVTLFDRLDVGEELANAEPSAAVKTLGRRVADALDVFATRKAKVEERDSRDAQRREAEHRIVEANKLIATMVESAGVSDEAGLLAAIERSEQHRRLMDQLAKTEDTLRSVASKPLDQIEVEAGELSAGLAGKEIRPEIEDLDRRVDELDLQIKATQTRVGELTNQRAQIDASGKAADRMADAQQSLARIAELADEYVQVVLARKLLDDQVKVYRDEHQGPLLARARELFRSLTLDRYTGLDTDTDEKGEHHLIAKTADGMRLETTQLSTGTRDQLYLALRLAALEQFIGRRGPLPLILDDLFVHFDDDRTLAGLGVLDKLAGQTQVLLFTHHDQVARQAREKVSPDRLTVHQLG